MSAPTLRPAGSGRLRDHAPLHSPGQSPVVPGTSDSLSPSSPPFVSRSGDRSRKGARDGAVDLARAVCLVWVVALHSLMVGVAVVGGAPALGNAMEGWGGFAALTWLGQIMPLFFLLGGFASWTQLERARLSADHGAPPSAWAQLGIRLARLLRPALAAAIASALSLAALAALGVTDRVLGEAGFRMAQPLWFLGVYAFCTALAPALFAAHRRAPALTVGALVAAAVSVDVVRSLSGIEAMGLANMAFVWLALQQGGFLLADGTLARMGRARLWWLAVGAAAALALSIAAGIYPADLLLAMTPPSCALLLLGAAHLFLFQLARDGLSRLASGARLSLVTAALNAHSMTIYSWHMPAVVLLAGASLLLFGEALPAPLSPEWWVSRPLWFLAVAAAVTPLVRWAGRWERRPGQAEAGDVGQEAPARRGLSTPARLAVLGCALASASPLAILMGGGELWAWVLGVAGLAAALGSANAAARS